MDVEGRECEGVASELAEAIREADTVWIESALSTIRLSKRQALRHLATMRRGGWAYWWTVYTGGTVVIRGYSVRSGGPRQRRERTS